MLSYLSIGALLLSAIPSVLASPLQRSSGLTERQIPCPPGLQCGHGPVCAPPFCELPGCADSAACQDASDASLKERSTEHPPLCDIICIEGPDGEQACGCNADAKRAIAEREPRACLQICESISKRQLLCGCDLEDYKKAHPGAFGSGGITEREVKRCPQYCITVDDGEFLCGCAAQDYEKSHPIGTELFVIRRNHIVSDT